MPPIQAAIVVPFTPVAPPVKPKKMVIAKSTAKLTARYALFFLTNGHQLNHRRNLYFEDYIEKHGEITVEDFKLHYDKEVTSAIKKVSESLL